MMDSDKGVIATDDEREAEKLADKGHNVRLTKEEEVEQETGMYPKEVTKRVGKEVVKALVGSLRDAGDGISSAKITNVSDGAFSAKIGFENGSENTYDFHISPEDSHIFIVVGEEMFEVGDIARTPSGEPIVHKDALKSNITKSLSDMYLEENIVKDIKGTPIRVGGTIKLKEGLFFEVKSEGKSVFLEGNGKRVNPTSKLFSKILETCIVVESSVTK